MPDIKTNTNSANNGSGVTTLSGALTDQPWNKYTFGQGIDAMTGALANSAVQPFAVTSGTTYDTTTRYAYISTQEDYQTAFSAEASGSYNMQGGQLSGSASYLQSVSCSETSLTIIAYYEIATDGYGTAPAWALTEQAQQHAQSDPNGFRQLYGDYFVANCTMGSRFIATYTCSAASAETLQSFKAAIQGNTDVFSVAGATSFSQQAQSSNVNVSVAIYMEGVDGPGPSPSADPSTIPTSLEWFLAHTAYVPRRAMLVHYSQIDASLPNTLHIDPIAFANIQTLGYLIAQIGSSLKTLPPYYSTSAIYKAPDTFGAAYNKLNDTYLAARAELPANTDLTASLTATAQDMISALQTPLTAYGFYQGLTTIAKNSGEAQGMTGTGTSTFGLTTTGDNTPVKIVSQSQNISEDWEVGHQSGTFNWPFDGVDNNQITTGWTIVCVWGPDGDDGSWTLNTPLIGRSSGQVSVESEYDRGLNWTLSVSYVENSNFPWLNT